MASRLNHGTSLASLALATVLSASLLRGLTSLGVAVEPSVLCPFEGVCALCGSWLTVRHFLSFALGGFLCWWLQYVAEGNHCPHDPTSGEQQQHWLCVEKSSVQGAKINLEWNGRSSCYGLSDGHACGTATPC